MKQGNRHNQEGKLISVMGKPETSSTEISSTGNYSGGKDSSGEEEPHVSNPELSSIRELQIVESSQSIADPKPLLSPDRALSESYLLMTTLLAYNI